MIDQIKYLASWTSVKLSKKLGQRGAEMVEYAIVLACVAAVGVYFYSQGKTEDSDANVAGNGLQATLAKLWKNVRTAVGITD